jgi:hypothetical protein
MLLMLLMLLQARSLAGPQTTPVPHPGSGWFMGSRPHRIFLILDSNGRGGIRRNSMWASCEQSWFPIASLWLWVKIETWECGPQKHDQFWMKLGKTLSTKKGQLWMSQTIPCSCVVRWHRLFFFNIEAILYMGFGRRGRYEILLYIYIHTICTHASYRPGWCFYHQTSLKSLGVINLLVCIGGAISKIAHQFSARFQIECLVRWINFLFIFG